MSSNGNTPLGPQDKYAFGFPSLHFVVFYWHIVFDWHKSPESCAFAHATSESARLHLFKICIRANRSKQLFNTGPNCRVKQLEGKLATLTVINGALQNENETLRHELKSARAPSSATESDLQELQEEFTRRLATADRTIASLKVCTTQNCLKLHLCMLEVPVICALCVQQNDYILACMHAGEE